MDELPENVLRISHLREVLGFACQQVALTGEPIILQRCNRQDVIQVPLVELRFLKQVAANGLLTSPGGNTPEGTLYVSILREVRKGKDARFVKTDRGTFELAKLPLRPPARRPRGRMLRPRLTVGPFAQSPHRDASTKSKR